MKNIIIILALALCVFAQNYHEKREVEMNQIASFAFGNGVTVDEPYRVVFFDCENPGRVGINRDADCETGVRYPIHVGVSGGILDGEGAHLTAPGKWTDASSRVLKDRYVTLEGVNVLNSIREMEIGGWYFIGTDEYHIGPFAEDFYEAFNTGVDSSEDVGKYLAPGDVAGVGLVAIQELARQIEALKEENAELRRRLETIEGETE